MCIWHLNLPTFYIIFFIDIPYFDISNKLLCVTVIFQWNILIMVRKRFISITCVIKIFFSLVRWSWRNIKAITIAQRSCWNNRSQFRRLEYQFFLLIVSLIVFIFVGIPIKSTLDNSTTVQYAGLISSLADKARSVVRDLDPTNELTFLRIRSKKHEIMVAPDKEFILIVVQNPTD